MPADDLGPILPPKEPPPATPDEKSEAEENDLRSPKPSKPSPLERAEESHRNHIETLSSQNAYYCGKIKELEEELSRLRMDLKLEAEEKTKMAVSCGKLEMACGNLGCMAVLGAIMVAIAGILLGVGGSPLSMSNEMKAGFTWGGAVAGSCGALLMIASYAVGWQSSKTIEK